MGIYNRLHLSPGLMRRRRLWKWRARGRVYVRCCIKVGFNGFDIALSSDAESPTEKASFGKVALSDLNDPEKLLYMFEQFNDSFNDNANLEALDRNLLLAHQIVNRFDHHKPGAENVVQKNPIRGVRIDNGNNGLVDREFSDCNEAQACAENA